jgi:hypothetical protein
MGLSRRSTRLRPPKRDLHGKKDQVARGRIFIRS